jgi:hypothetical protein
MATVTNQPGQLNFGNPGDTIQFEGTHTLSNAIFPGDRNYTGSGRITGGNQWTVIFKNAANVRITGLLFDNANLLLEQCRNFHISTPFRNMVGRGEEKSHAIRCVQLRDSTIIGDFKDMLKADTCIEGWDALRCTFSNGKFVNVHEGIHFTWFSPSQLWDCYFDKNIIDGIRRHGIELQRFARKISVKRNHISRRLANGIGLSIATGGDGGYEGTQDIEVDDNVVDNTGFPMPDPSQCMGIELMGRAKCRNNFIVNGGQGIAITYNPPNTEVTGNRFKGMPKNWCIVADPPRDKYITPIGLETNDYDYDGAIPTAEQTTGGTVPPIPPTPEPDVPVILTPTDGKLEIGKQYECTGSGTAPLNWGIDRLGDGLADFASGTGASFKFTVPADSLETQQIEIKLRDFTGASTSKKYPLVKPTAPTPSADDPVVGVDSVVRYKSGKTQVFKQTPVA